MSLQWPPEEPRGVGAFGCEPTSFFLCVCVPDPSEVSIMSSMGRMMALSATVTTRWGLDRPARRGARNLSEHFFKIGAFYEDEGTNNGAQEPLDLTSAGGQEDEHNVAIGSPFLVDILHPK